MFTYSISPRQINTTIEYHKEKFINVNSSVGNTFFHNGNEVDVENISTSEFVNAVTILGDEMNYIIDDAMNVYYKVIQFTIISTEFPERL